MIRSLLFLLTVLLHTSTPAKADDEKTIVVLGSSVASGWVTSFEERHDMLNGYAWRLGRLLAARGYSLKNVSIPGNDTSAVLERMQQALEGVGADMVIIGLSLGNEGIEGPDPEGAYASYEKGMRAIIERCRAMDIIPIAGSCYACDTYDDEAYEYTKRMNLQMNRWGVPVINFLGALDDGRGRFVPGCTYDAGHPDNRGHEELFYAVVPSLFEALEAGKPVPSRSREPGFTTIGGFPPLSHVPDDVIHSFTLAFTVRDAHPGHLATLFTRTGEMELASGEEGRLIYNGIESEVPLCDGKWHDVVLSHRHLAGETRVFVDGRRVLEHGERVEPLRFVIGGADFRDLLIYRSALNGDEAAALHEGAMVHGSLEVYAPLRNEALKHGKEAVNAAQSTSRVVATAEADTTSMEALYVDADRLRAREPVFEEKSPVDVDPSIFEKLVGKYQLAPGVNMAVSTEEGKLYLTDPDGGVSELFPESESRFFIKFPLAEITVSFESGETGEVKGLVFSVDGRKDRAKKIT